MKKIMGAIGVVLLIISCETVGTGIDAASKAGFIDAQAADALGRMNEAISDAAQDITPSEEYYIGRAVGANILSNYTLYTEDPELTAYVNKILGVLVINSPRPTIYNGYHAAILDTDEINGFSTSGGHIFITRGLLDVADSEDALAAVLAHELAHILLQHSVKSIKNSRFTSAIQQVAGIAAEAAGLDELTRIFDESIREAVSNALDKGYSREQEYEADEAAVSLLAAAGYTPSSIVGMLESIKANAAQSGGKAAYPSVGSVLQSTHPSPDDRLQEIKRKLVAYQGFTDNTEARKPRFDATLKK
ncbi:MAG: M48 family metalloprotease [Treponema sp.]|jgi:predicted Zn-dependent protease|nr:M48 family metalloprotease [Treponema sp.]